MPFCRDSVDVLFTHIFLRLQMSREEGVFSLIFMIGILQVNLLAGRELIRQAMTANPIGDVTGVTTFFSFAILEQFSRSRGGFWLARPMEYGL